MSFLRDRSPTQQQPMSDLRVRISSRTGRQKTNCLAGRGDPTSRVDRALGISLMVNIQRAAPEPLNSRYLPATCRAILLFITL
ncbi:MAG TPA: hypothetical protein PJ991_05990 [Kiritimatiellia bacterium]|nr:hypothetical protein [Kiritimatiellia bacterium]